MSVVVEPVSDPERARQKTFTEEPEAAGAEPTALVRDHLRQHGGDRPVATAVLPEVAAVAAHASTSGDPGLAVALGGAVLAMVAARATDRPEVTVLLPVTDATQAGGSRSVPVTVTVAGRRSARELLDRFREAYRKSLTDAGVARGVPSDTDDIRPTDLMLALGGNLSAADAADRGCPVLFDLWLAPDAGPARVEVRYDARTVAEATARRLALSFAELFGVVIGESDRICADLLAAGPADRALIAEFNATQATFPAHRTLHSFLEERAATSPDAIAVADDGMSYRELNVAANRLARVLRSHGVGPGDLVGVAVPRSPVMLVAVYAVLKAGGAYLPIDPTLPRNRIDYILDHSGAALVLVTGATSGVAPGRQTIDVTDQEVPDHDGTDLPPVSGPDDLAYVIYTSGSTGRPKGVMIEHRAIVNRLWWMQAAYPLSPHDVVLHKTPFTFDVSVWEIFWWSLAGASVATLPSGAERDPQQIARRIVEAGVTTIHFVPSMLHAFLRYVASSSASADLSSLRRVFASGEALVATHVEEFRRRLGDSAELVNLYGPTEAAVDVTWQSCADVDVTRPIPIGRPITNLRMYVRTRSGAMAPIGTPGELCIAGTGLARGYLAAPELTDERFVPNPFENGGRIYRTGDLARWLDDGTIEYLGRIDDQVKIRGYRIELGEIEHLARACGGVADCAVTAEESRAGGLTLVAYVVRGAGYALERLRAALAAELPSYMLPRQVVEVAAIPTSHNGKRDLRALAGLRAGTSPDSRGARPS